MRSRFVIKIFATLSILMFAISLNTGVATSAEKITAGTICKSLNKKATYQNKTFTCKKVGKRLVWSKGVPVKSAKPNTKNSSASNPSPNFKDVPYEQPNKLATNLEKCKLRDLSRARLDSEPGLVRVGTGFPELKGPIPTKGTITWALIPIDFPDLPGEANFRSRVDKQMSMLSDWYQTVSENQLTIQWSIADTWIRMPKPSTEYKIDMSSNLDMTPNGIKLWQDAMKQSDLSFDFSKIQTVNFLLPKGQRFVVESSQGFPQDQAVRNLNLSEGKVHSFSIPGQFFDLPGKEYWSYWAHEFGHAIGIGHIGSSRASNPFQFYDLLGAQDGPSRELSGWLRFYAGWLNDNQVYCFDVENPDTTEITLVPLSSNEKGLKVVVIPTSSTKAIVIESRRVTKFDCKTPTPRNGILAYTYDATLGHGDELFEAFTPNLRPLEMDECGSKNNRTEPSRNLLLTEGDAVEILGYRIEVIAHGNRDKVKITRKR